MDTYSEKCMTARKKIPFWSNLCRTYGYPSSSKFLQVIGGIAGIVVLMITAYRSEVPENLAELTAAVLFALVLGRGASKAINAWEQKNKNNKEE